MVRKSANHCFTLEKNKFFKEQIRKTFGKKMQKTVVLKTLIQNANILLALEELPQYVWKKAGKNIEVDVMLNYIKKCFTPT